MEAVIKYIPAQEEPLSSDVVIIKGDKSTWLYDVGASDAAFLEISRISGVKTAILSHFHPDHIANLKRLQPDEIYLGKNTFKYVGRGTVAEEEITIADGGVTLRIIPFPSSHAKGCLALEVNRELLFLGDGLCPQIKGGKYYYNVQHLISQISLLEKSPAVLLALGHEGDKHIPKEVILEKLKKLLLLKDKSSSFIEADDFI